MTAHRKTRVSFGSRLPDRKDKQTSLLIITILTALFSTGACTSVIRHQEARPLVMRDVPAQRLAFRFEPDVAVPDSVGADEPDDRIEAIQLDFNTRRPNDALLRAVRSPDGQRAVVLYGTADAPSQEFHLDLYAADGKFLRNLTPPDLGCVFRETVSWSPDGNFITFIGHRSLKPTPTPAPLGVSTPEPPESTESTPLPSVAPAFAPVTVFSTEQIYVCNRDGYDLRPLTSREGLIYFYASWAPDNHALLAMACKESEWDTREREFKLPVGRPRLLTLEGKERLLDDELTEALPVWSPDSSKVADAFESDLMIYDAASPQPTQARIRLRDTLISASRSYEERKADPKKTDSHDANKPKEASAADAGIPVSFNPAIRLEWVSPEKLFFETAYVKLLPNEPITTFQRWHLVALSPQAAVLK
jgi:WD40 repeat protein